MHVTSEGGGGELYPLYYSQEVGVGVFIRVFPFGLAVVAVLKKIFECCFHFIIVQIWLGQFDDLEKKDGLVKVFEMHFFENEK